VAWSITVARVRVNGRGHLLFSHHQSLNYIGKPNRLRALEARKFINKARLPGFVLYDMFQASFDKAGLLGYIIQRFNRTRYVMGCGAFTAYHPHIAPPHVEVVEAFVKPLHLKYIGGMRLYSQKKTLKVEELETYYEWYHKQFGRKLRRPKAGSMSVIANELVGAEPSEPEEPEPEPQEVPF
jgi:hypothetical protein